MKRTRYNYWSLSKFSKWLRTKAGLDNPYALTMEDWDEHRKSCKEIAPFTEWFTNRFLNKLQNVVYFIPDLWWSFKTATVWKFFRTVWVFKEVLWNYRRWDFSGLLQFMETAARDMSDCHKKYGHLMRSEETAKEMYVWAELLKRVREDAYRDDKEDFIIGEGMFGGKFVQKPNTLPNINSKGFHKIVQFQRRDDLKLAAKIFERKILYWWD